MNLVISIFQTCTAVKSAIVEFSHGTIIFDDVQSLREARKKKNLLAHRENFFNQLIYQSEFSRGFDNVLSKFIRAWGLNTFKKIWVVANFS